MSTQSVAPKVGTLGQVVWGFGSLGTIGYLNTVTALVMVYLTTIVQLNPLLAGSLVAGARVFDAFTDPAMGWLSDRTRTRWGRRRPYLLLGAVICGLALPTLYALPMAMPVGERAFWATVVLLFYSLGFTVFNVPYMTMAVEMTSEPQARMTLTSFRVVFMMIGGYIGNAAAPAAVKFFGGGASAYAEMGLVFGAVIFAVMLGVCLFVPDRSVQGATVRHAGLREQLRTAMENKPLMILLGVKVLQFIGIAANSATLAFFVTTVLKRDFNTLALIGTASLAATFVGVLLWRAVARRVSKKAGFITGVIFYILGTASWLLSGPQDPVSVLVARSVFVALFASGILLFGQAILLDAVEYDRLRTGLERSGLFTSAYVFIERLGYSLGPVLLGALLAAMHFDKTLPLDRQPPSASVAVILSLVGIPVVTFALSLVLLFRYDLSEERLARLRVEDAERPPRERELMPLPVAVTAVRPGG